jgi:hypothetical protein
MRRQEADSGRGSLNPRCRVAHSPERRHLPGPRTRLLRSARPGPTHPVVLSGRHARCAIVGRLDPPRLARVLTIASQRGSVSLPASPTSRAAVCTITSFDFGSTNTPVPADPAAQTAAPRRAVPIFGNRSRKNDRVCPSSNGSPGGVVASRTQPAGMIGRPSRVPSFASSMPSHA